MLKVENLTVRIAGRLLLEDANLSLPSGTRAGLVGKNGCGKTTLFKVLLGEHPSETGDVSIPKSWQIGQVAQEAPGTEDSLLEIVLAADKERAELLSEAETASDPDRIAAIYERLDDIDAYTAESRAASILAGLGFSEQDQQAPASSFSGGWRMRVALAAVLFSEPDLLLLDEPTNYLDLEGTLWLENYLSRYPGTVLVISHDRDLLNVAVDSIIHFENRHIQFFKGNFDTFEHNRELQRELASKTREKLEKQIAHMQGFVDRFKAKASKARQAQSKIKAIAKIKLPAMLEEEGTRPFHFPAPEKIVASPAIKLESVRCGYAKDAPVLHNLDLRIDSDDRIALLGSNGNGKSTFAKLLAGRLPHVDGNVVMAPKLQVAMFAQHQMDDLHADQTPVDHVRKLMAKAPESIVRSRTAQMGLDHERMNTLTAKLSGGEKARLLLGLCTFHGPDILILDEPTNHLDMGAREALVHAINEFSGAVILVSHDRHLIDATTERLWIVRDGTVSPYEEDLATYRKEVLQTGRKRKDQLVAAPEPEPASPPATQQLDYDERRELSERRRKLAPLKQKISEKEYKIQKLAEDISKLDSALLEPGLYENNPDKAARISKMRASAEKQKVLLEEEWLSLSDEYEAGLVAKPA